MVHPDDERYTNIVGKEVILPLTNRKIKVITDSHVDMSFGTGVVKNAGIKAGAWIKEIAPIVGGGGGGRDDFAQAGGKDASRVDEAKTAALAYAKKVLQG